MDVKLAIVTQKLHVRNQ